MGLFDLFTNDASQDAYARNNAFIQQGIGAGTGALTSAYANAQRMLGTNNGGNALNALNIANTQGRNVLNAGYDNAQGRLGLLGQQLNSTINQGGQQARGDLNAGFADAAGALRGGYQDARGDYSQIANSYNPMIRGGQRSFDAFLDSTGANGARGSDRALDNFRAGPGYEFQQSQGQDAIMRSAAARGGLAGGNTSVDLLKYSQGLADQEFDDYQANLRSGADFLTTGLAGRNAALTNRANAAQSYGQNAANLNAQRGTSLGALGQAMTGLRSGAQQAVGMADAQMGANRGTALAGLGQSIGAARAGLYGTGAGNAMNLGSGLAGLQLGGMNALTSNSNSLAQSENQQSQNLWGGLLGLGSLAAAPMTGGATVGGSLLGGLRSIFG